MWWMASDGWSMGVAWECLTTCVCTGTPVSSSSAGVCSFRAALLGAGASCTVQLTGLCSDMDALCARARDVLELLEEKEEEGEEAREHVDTNMFLKARNRHRVRFLVRTQRSSHAHTVQCTTLH